MATKENLQEIDGYLNLLKRNHNLILTGAPGTGKTYLAKEIAKKMIGITADEKIEQSEQFDFVQFHPSYDYTDFVEGLRPTQPDENGNIGFELRDGLFKTFCKKALQNLNDSKKDKKVIKKERKIDVKINNFLIKAIEEKIELTLKNSNSFYITDFDDRYIKMITPKNEKTANLSLKISDLKKVLLSGEKFSQVKDIGKIFNRDYNLQLDSYLFSLNEALSTQTIEDESEISKEKVEKKSFVFIIDEINRAEISKVFGELFFSLDPGYRGEKGRVKTQYANMQEDDDLFFKGFFIPENVYIIGTMNDIDRSVESFDFAMRRRFAWKEIKAEDRISMWNDEIDEYKDEAKKRMKSLNEEIEKTPGLNAAYHIGPAYFLKLKIYNGDFTKLWENHLEGILKEYLRGLPNIDETLEKLKSAYDYNEQKDAENY